MTAAYQCPACGKYDIKVKKVWLGVEVSGNQSRVYQFCPDCAESLSKWLESRKNQGK